jgi:hypothetical protein
LSADESFEAQGVAVSTLEDLNTFLIMLAENADGSGRRLEIQRALSFDEQDRKLGMDTYCLCTESGTHYGGVESWTLGDDTLILEFEKKASRALRLERRLIVRLRLTPKLRRELTAGLRRAIDDR